MIAACEPLSVSVLLPLLPALTVVPGLSVTSNVPFETLSCTVAIFSAATLPDSSASATETPGTAVRTSSSTASEAGRVLTGVSFWLETLTVSVPSTLAVPSLTV